MVDSKNTPTKTEPPTPDASNHPPDEGKDAKAPTRAAPRRGLQVHGDRQSTAATVERDEEVPVWHPDHETEPPLGSTSESLLVYERGVPVRVADPTHYHVLADGRTVLGYTVGTHYTEGNGDGTDSITPIYKVIAG